MAFPCNLHTHSLFCDGVNTLEDMVQAAIGAGLKAIGLSGHGPAEYDSAAMPQSSATEYLAEGRRLQQKYKGQIEVCVGMEIDAYSFFEKSKLDYCIGSVHYILDSAGQKRSVDHNDTCFRQALEAFGGPRQMVEQYCQAVEMMLDTLRPDIIGHLDIITKLNCNGKYFDQRDPWYLDAEERLARAAAKSGCIAEVNTAGFAARGELYPSRRILTLLRQLDAPLTLTSDAHSAGRIHAEYDRAVLLLKEIGFTHLKLMKDGQFADWRL